MSHIEPNKALAELRSKLAKLEDHEQLLRGELADISYQAHALNEAKARARVTEIAVALGTIGVEAESLRAAMSQAERLVAASLAADTAIAEAAKAKTALTLAKQLRDCMKAADQAQAAFAARMVEARQLVLELRDQGGPGYLPAMNALKRAHITGIMGTPLQEQHLGPKERITD